MTTNQRPRARDLGIAPGWLPTGALNAITDVPGVKVGHVTRIEGEGPLVRGSGPIRTGVTAIWPHSGDLYDLNTPGVVYRINGFGEVTNALQVEELGVLEGPIMLGSTLNVPLIEDAGISWAAARYPEMGVTSWGFSLVVAECSDAWLNDGVGRHIREEHVWAAIDNATGGPVEEGNVGGGTGDSCFEFKGGIGTSSRTIDRDLRGERLPQPYTVGVLVMSNFGRRWQLRVNGVPVGRELERWNLDEATTWGFRPALTPTLSQGERESVEKSSIIMVLGTDAPMDPRQLRRLAVRCGAGLARTGSVHGNGSGDFVIAFSNANLVPRHPDPKAPLQRQDLVAEEGPLIDMFFEATVEATEEAILNSLFRAETMTGRDGHTRHAIPIAETVEIMRRYGHAGVHLPSPQP